MSDVDSFWRKRVEREEAEIANRLAQSLSGMSRHSTVSKTSFNVMGVPQIIRRGGAGSHAGRVAKSEVLRVNHDEAAPAVDNPFKSSVSEADGAAARFLTSSGIRNALVGRGASRASSRASSRGILPFKEITIPPSSSNAPSEYSYPETPNFSEGGTSAIDPELLERLERLEMALEEEKKARANVEQRLQKIKEEDEQEKTSVTSSGAGKGTKKLQGAKKAVRENSGRVSSTSDERVVHTKPPSLTASSASKRASFR